MRPQVKLDPWPFSTGAPVRVGTVTPRPLGRDDWNQRSIARKLTLTVVSGTLLYHCIVLRSSAGPRPTMTRGLGLLPKKPGREIADPFWISLQAHYCPTVPVRSALCRKKCDSAREAPASHFFIKLVFAALESSLPLLLTALALQESRLHFLMKLVSSGAHFDPAVTLTFLRLKEIAPWDAAFYSLAQLVGGLVGVLVVHAAPGPQ
jgi:hypothetical protein